MVAKCPNPVVEGVELMKHAAFRCCILRLFGQPRGAALLVVRVGTGALFARLGRCRRLTSWPLPRKATIHGTILDRERRHQAGLGGPDEGRIAHTHAVSSSISRLSVGPQRQEAETRKRCALWSAIVTHLTSCRWRRQRGRESKNS